ncbi:MAG: ankyrin repeat domain-containing protein [bacterium]
MMCAAGEGSPKMVKLLLDNGADVNLKDENQETALMKAIKSL